MRNYSATGSMPISHTDNKKQGPEEEVQVDDQMRNHSPNHDAVFLLNQSLTPPPLPPPTFAALAKAPSHSHLAPVAQKPLLARH